MCSQHDRARTMRLRASAVHEHLFTKDDSSPYVEVHHMGPRGGRWAR